MLSAVASHNVLRSADLLALREVLDDIDWFCAYLADDVYYVPATAGAGEAGAGSVPVWPPYAGTPALPGIETTFPGLIKQGAAGNPPTYSPSSAKYNSRPSVGFSTSALKTPSLFTASAAPPCTVVVVGHADTVGVNRFLCGGSADASGRDLFRGSGSRMNARGTSAGGTIVHDAAFTSDQVQIHVFVLNGASSRHRVNGYEAVGTTTSSATQQLRVGCRSNQATNDALVGALGFIGMVEGEMSTPDIEALEEAFADYYALTLAPDTYLRGGQVTEPGDGFRYHLFTSGETLEVVGPGSVTVDYMVAGGGGGSSRTGTSSQATGGGGGGQVLTGTGLVISANQAVTVGAGGTAGASGTVGGNGGASSIGALVSAAGGGGGGAGSTTLNGVQGGSGGGGSANGASVGTGGAANGAGTSAGGGAVANKAGGGGGGAGGAGANAPSATVGGAGGAGVEWPTGSGTYYGGGGGGGAATGGAGGSGGGGAGANAQGGAPTANTGGGAGGSGPASAVGRAGATGMVIVRYAI